MNDGGFSVESLWDINRLQNMCYCVSGWAFSNYECGFDFLREIGVFYKIRGVLYFFFVKYFNRELFFNQQKETFVV